MAEVKYTPGNRLSTRNKVSRQRALKALCKALVCTPDELRSICGPQSLRELAKRGTAREQGRMKAGPFT